MEQKEICEPIKTFEEVMRFSSMDVKKYKFYKFPEKSVSFIHKNFDCHLEGDILQSRKKFDTRIVPKTLVCHDMKGGYLEDKFVHGCASGHGYTFYQWSNIDIFVYFSHHLITIPPVGWINLAHNNNVKILGTIITEFDEGVLICDKIFKTEETWQDFAKAVINICLIHNFDGWLLNFENVICKTESLVKFVTYLTEEMHKINPHFTVIWYDSVTKEGKLKWQNELNDLNKCYFDVCDGIFLNYSWNEENLQNSLMNAGKRHLDVYVGVDVFGRNFYKGGGFNCDLAATIIRDLGLSLAIFAQGWTHETLHPKTLDNFYEIFLHKDNAFWLKLYPHLYTKPIENEFTTTFYTGADKYNYNLNLQQQIIHMPVHSGQTYFNKECSGFCECIQLYSDTEGCKPNRLSYLITTAKLNNKKKYVHRLFTCNLSVESKCVIQTVTKEGNKENSLIIVVLLQDKDGKYENKHLTEFKTRDKSEGEFEGISKGWIIKEYSFFVSKPTKLFDIGVILDGKAILLGGFSVKTFKCQNSMACT